ncbi:hypothetical protein IWX47DRAFT_577361 [Phyllosticta citricarpa]|uniref:Uncharacterized protein n=1 Tax=Phyllosticta citricarpa TaxID=55181 RepID=A0ABR1MJL3_9PEZI
MVTPTAPSLFCTKCPNALRSASLASRNHPRAVACRLSRPIICARHFPVLESLPSGPSRSRSVPAGRLRLGTCIDTRIASTLQTVFHRRLPRCLSSVFPPAAALCPARVARRLWFQCKSRVDSGGRVSFTCWMTGMAHSPVWKKLWGRGIRGDFAVSTTILARTGKYRSVLHTVAKLLGPAEAANVQGLHAVRLERMQQLFFFTMVCLLFVSRAYRQACSLQNNSLVFLTPQMSLLSRPSVPPLVLQVCYTICLAFRRHILFYLALFASKAPKRS